MMKEANPQEAKGSAWGGERLIKRGRKGHWYGALTKLAIVNYGNMGVNNDSERLRVDLTRHGIRRVSKSISKQIKASKPV
jgi:hypothetical protein